MAAAAQLYGSAAAVTTYRRTRAYSIPSSCQGMRNLLAGSPKTNRLLPWGFYASLSTAMVCFYGYVLLAGGNPPPKKLVAIPPQ
nr:unnamed protein product [Digitaria exilis]